MGLRAEYLDDITSTNEHIDPEKLGIELTRPPRGLKLWVTLQVLGENEIKRRIEHGQEMARYVEQQVQQMKNWKIVTTSQLSIINIRYEDPTKTPEENDQVMQFARFTYHTIRLCRYVYYRIKPSPCYSFLYNSSRNDTR